MHMEFNSMSTPHAHTTHSQQGHTQTPHSLSVPLQSPTASGRVGRQLYWRRQLSTHLSPPSVVFETVDLIVHSLPVTPLAMNQYLLGCKRKKIAALIDCGCDRPERWIQAAAKNGMVITSLLQTHGHLDHICGLKATKSMLPQALIYAHPADWYIYNSAPVQGLLFDLACPMPPARDKDIVDRDEIQVGALKMSVRHCPGHSPGHVAFLVQPSTATPPFRGQHSCATSPPHPPLLFCGDLIFAGSVGRTDFPGCSSRDMNNSLSRLAELPRETLLFPGHRELTTLGEELDTNPFLKDLG